MLPTGMVYNFCKCMLQEREQKKIKSKKKGKERRAAQKAERARQAAAQLLVNQANEQVSSRPARRIVV